MKKDGTVICSHCGKAISIEYRYCPYCGYEVIDDYMESEIHSPQTLMEAYVKKQLSLMEAQSHNCDDFKPIQEFFQDW